MPFSSALYCAALCCAALLCVVLCYAVVCKAVHDGLRLCVFCLLGRIEETCREAPLSSSALVPPYS